MKTVNTDLSTYMANEKNFETCDLYKITLQSGSIYYFANYDVDVVWNNHTWYHNRGMFIRNQTKMSGKVSVDSMTVTIACDSNDKIDNVPFMKACHNGKLDQGLLAIYKVYFLDGVTVGGYEIFEGKTEVSSAGGLKVKLTVKSYTQGLSQLVPIRIFAPQSAYANINGTITTSSTDTASMLIPLKPSGKVLISL